MSKFLTVCATLGLLTMVGLGHSVYAQEKKAATPAKTTKADSACKGLDEGACKGKTAECAWISPKTGKQKAYCRTKVAKKAAPSKDPAKK